MKSSMRKIIASVCMAFVFACAAVVSGVMLFTNSKSTNPTASSVAASSPSSVVFEVNGKSDTVSVSPGSTIKVKATFTSRSGRFWNAIACTLTALKQNESGALVTDHDALNYLSFTDEFIDDGYTAPSEVTSVFRSNTYDMDVGSATLASSIADAERGIAIGLSIKRTNNQVDGGTSAVYEFELIIDENIDLDSITLGIRPLGSNKVVTHAGTTTGSTITDTAEAGTFTANSVTVQLRSEKTEADIGDIDIGVGGEDDDDIDIGSEPDPENPDKPYFDENGDVVIYLPDDPSKTVKVNYPKMQEGSEGATVKVATSASKTNRPTASAFAGNDVGENGKDVAVTVDKNVIHVQVTSEDGATTVKYYTITCIFTYVRLSDLVPEADVSELDNTDDIKNGYKDPDTFDKDTYEYEVYVPGDATEVTATVAPGYGASNTIQLTAANCTLANTTANSGDTFTVSEIGEDATLELKVTAKGGNPDPNTHTYKLTFVAVSTDADLKTLVVKGADLKMEAKNDADQATENHVDYYYLVVDTDPIQALMTITANDSNAKIEVKGSTGEYSNYSPTKKYDPDTYTIKITSEAGNYNEYTVMLTKRDFLKLIDNSDYDFLTLLQEVRDGVAYQYRVSYDYLNWKHGLDDIYVDRFYDIGWREGVDDETLNSDYFNYYVLGHIGAGTKVTDFVLQIDEEQRKTIEVYNAAGTLIYANNAVQSTTYDSELNIGTGARVEFGTDVVYCSVLGDVNGDADIDTADAAQVTGYYYNTLDRTKFNPIYMKMALMVANDGTITTADVSLIMGYYYRNITSLTPYYDNYVKTN